MTTAGDSAAPPLPMRLEAFDRLMLDEDSRSYPMVFPQAFEFTGEADPVAFRKAFDAALDRHQVFRARLRFDKSEIPWFDWNRPRRPPLDFRSGEFPRGLATYSRSPYIRAGMAMVVRTGGGRTRVIHLIHHAYSDGIGSFRFFSDLLALYGESVGGAPAALTPCEPDRLAGRGDTMRFGAERNVKPVSIAELMMALIVPTATTEALPLASPRAARFDPPRQTFPGIVLRTLDAKRHQAVRKAAEKQGLSTHDLLSFAAFRMIARWNREHGKTKFDASIRLAVPVDLRGRGDETMPAANVVGMTYPQTTIDVVDDDDRLTECVRAIAMRTRVDNLGAKLNQGMQQSYEMTRITRTVLRGNRCYATAILSNVGDPTRRFSASLPRVGGKIVAGNLTLESIYGVSPMRRGTRVAIGSQSYNRELILSMRADPYRFAISDTERLMDAFCREIDERIERWG